MKYRWLHLTILCVLAVVMVSCASSGSGSGGTTVNPQTTSTPLIQNGAMKVGAISPTIDLVSKQVLTNMHLHAWNPAAMTRGVTTGGLFINWKMSDPSLTNAVKAGADGNTQHNHDPQVDLMYLTVLAQYQQIHPQDTTYSADVTRALPLVLADFKTYSLPKGWIYFYLLRDGQMLHNTALVNEAHGVANNLYSHWYDPALGTVYNRTHSSRDYSTDSTVDSGAALIDAGMRWSQPSWVSAGEKTLDHTIASALDPKYHLFYNSMYASSSGHDKVENYQAKPSTQGESADELLTAYTLTHNQHYLDVAGQVLQSLFSTSGLWDKVHGGFYFALDMQSGQVFTGYKETRSTSLTLLGVNHYNQVASQPMTQQEQELTVALDNSFYQHTYHGYFYRVTTAFQVYVSAPGQGIGTEDYFTTEAMGDSLDALQQTELLPS